MASDTTSGKQALQTPDPVDFLAGDAREAGEFVKVRAQDQIADATLTPEQFPPLPPPRYVGEPEAGFTVKSIVGGGDDRRPVTDIGTLPYQAICHLEVSYAFRSGAGTGCLIHPGLVLTAAHVILHPDFGRAQTIRVIPARSGQGYRHSQVSLSDDMFTNARWGQGGVFKPQHDYGVVRLPDRNAFRPFGWVRFQSLTDDQYRRLETSSYQFTVAGYPVDQKYGTQWTARGTISHVQDETFRHQVDTYDGQSGAPFICYNSQSQPLVVGVHSKQSADDPQSNLARRLDVPAVADLQSWLGTLPPLTS